MKKAILFAALIVFSASVFSQEKSDNMEMKTLFGSNEKTTHGGYGGISVNYSHIDGRDAVLVGGRGAWIINHGIGIGLAGYGFANEIKYSDKVNDKDDNCYLIGGYGGFLIEPIFGALRPVHISIPILIGGGGVAYNRNGWWNNDDNKWEYYTIDSSPFFVIEPGVEIELNIIKFIRIAVGGYYRYTAGMNLINTDSHALDSFSCGITLKFGKF